MKVVFLDRDGVINKYPGDRLYVTSRGSFRFLPRAKKAISLLSKEGFKIFVVSSQTGVGKEIYNQKTQIAHVTNLSLECLSRQQKILSLI